MRQKLYISGLISFTAACAAVAGLALVSTNPSQIGPFGVTVWFLIVFAAISGACSLGFFLVKVRLVEASENEKLNTSVRQGMIVGCAVTALLALRSLRQLSLRDVILILILSAIAEFYLRTRT